VKDPIYRDTTRGMIGWHDSDEAVEKDMKDELERLRDEHVAALAAAKAMREALESLHKEFAPVPMENPMKLEDLVKEKYLQPGDYVWTTEEKLLHQYRGDRPVETVREIGAKGRIDAILHNGKVRVKWLDIGMIELDNSLINKYQKFRKTPGRRLMERLLHYEEFYSSGADGHPRYFH